MYVKSNQSSSASGYEHDLLGPFLLSPNFGSRRLGLWRGKFAEAHKQKISFKAKANSGGLVWHAKKYCTAPRLA